MRWTTCSGENWSADFSPSEQMGKFPRTEVRAPSSLFHQRRGIKTVETGRRGRNRAFL